MNLRVHARDTVRLLYPVRVVLLGLAVCQVIGTVLVYLSNRALAAKIVAIQAAGYGPLPGVNIDPPLSSLEAAFAGGSFFTLSTGAGVVMLAFAGTLLVMPLPSLYRAFRSSVLSSGWRLSVLTVLLVTAFVAALPVIAWAALLVLANVRGFCPGLTAFLALVPPVVIWATVKWAPGRAGHPRLAWRNPVHFTLIAILLALWGARLDADVFLNFKDNLLLTSAPGVKVVDFYYRYTLYPAEVFKRLADKQIKTVQARGVDDPGPARRLASVLERQGYFLVPGHLDAADVQLVFRQDDIFLQQAGKTVRTVDRKTFMTSAADQLNHFSEATDRHAFFRRFTLLALMGVAPLVLYLLVYGLFCTVSGMAAGIRTASLLAPVLCFIFWGGIIFYLDMPPAEGFSQERAATAIREGDRRERLAALRYIHAEGLDITCFPGYEDLLQTPDPAHRYWLIKALGKSRAPVAATALARFLASDSAYLVCKAIEAGAVQAERQEPQTRQRYREQLVRKMETSPNWYVQFYAYKAARRLGWKPPKSV